MSTDKEWDFLLGKLEFGNLDWIHALESLIVYVDIER